MELKNTNFTGGFEAPITGMELNVSTPCGLFETTTGERYIVTNDCIGEIAIALRHRTSQAFARIPLTSAATATGVWFGDGEIELIHVAPDDTNTVGTLSIEEDGWINLICQRECGRASKHMIAGTSETAEVLSYDGWRILKGGKIFFEWMPPISTFPLVLPFNMLRSATGM